MGAPFGGRQYAKARQFFTVKVNTMSTILHSITFTQIAEGVTVLVDYSKTESVIFYTDRNDVISFVATSQVGSECLHWATSIVAALERYRSVRKYVSDEDTMSIVNSIDELTSLCQKVELLRRFQMEKAWTR